MGRRLLPSAVGSSALAAAVVLGWALSAGADETPASPPPPVEAPLTAGQPLEPAAEQNPSRALELHDEARASYARGEYRQAILLLEEAAQLDPEAKILHYNIGLIAEKLGDLEVALLHYRLCLELEQDGDERQQLARIIKRLEGARTGSELLAPAAAEPAPRRPPPPSPRSSPVTPWAYAGGATALCAFIVAVGLASRASALEPSAEETVTGPGTTLEDLQTDADAAHDLAIGADVALGIGLLATAATVVLVLIAADDMHAQRSSGRGAPSARLAVELAPARGRLTWRF